MIYLKLDTFSDFLALELLNSYYENLTGYFVQDTATPWQIWWAIPNRFFTSKVKEFVDSMPWEQGNPEGKTRKVSWQTLLGKIALERDLRNHIHSSIIIKTPSQKAFMQVIKTHFLLQQGQIYFTSPSKESNFYLIKIINPSLWCLSTIAEEPHTIYNEIPNINNLFVEVGWSLLDNRPMHKLNIFEGNVFLLHGDSSIESYNVEWTGVSKIIDIKNDNMEILQGDDDIRIPIALKLTDYENDSRPTRLWRVDDPQKLVNILSQINYQYFSGFKAWFSEQGSIFVMSDKDADIAVCSMLDDSFERFGIYKKRVFFPIGKTLIPLLPEDMILATYQSRGGYLCFYLDGEETSVLQLPIKHCRNLDFYIEFMAQTVIHEIENFKSKWHFDLGKILSKPVFIGNAEDKNHFSKELKPISFKKNILNSSEVEEELKPTVIKPKEKVSTQEEKIALHKELKNTDQNLLTNIYDPDLWLLRSQISNKLKNYECALVALLTSRCILRDNKNLFRALEKSTNRPKKLSKKVEKNLFSKDISASERGKILADVRSEQRSAELNFLYQTYFALRFNDVDVFDLAVNTMRSGYYNSEISFHHFQDFSNIEGHASVDHLLGEEEKKRIYKSAEKFLQQIESYDPRVLECLVYQFRILFSGNLNDPLFEVPSNPKINWSGSWLNRLKCLQEHPKIPIENPSKSLREWTEKISMTNFRSSSIENLFTGDIYRPVFTFNFQENIMEKVERLYKKYCDNDNWQDDFAKQSSAQEKAEIQRMLLYFVTKYGPINEFKEYVHKLDKLEHYEFYEVILRCDVYRLSLMYNINISEDDFFHNMIEILPHAQNEHGITVFLDFRDALENVILCLYLSQSNKRQKFFDDILKKSMDWIENHLDTSICVDEMLSLIAYLQVNIIYNKLPESVSAYNFYSRKKSIWMDYANYLANLGMESIREQIFLT